MVLNGTFATGGGREALASSLRLFHCITAESYRVILLRREEAVLGPGSVSTFINYPIYLGKSKHFESYKIYHKDMSCTYHNEDD